MSMEPRRVGDSASIVAEASQIPSEPPAPTPDFDECIRCNKASPVHTAACLISNFAGPKSTRGERDVKICHLHALRHPAASASSIVQNHLLPSLSILIFA